MSKETFEEEFPTENKLLSYVKDNKECISYPLNNILHEPYLTMVKDRIRIISIDKQRVKEVIEKLKIDMTGGWEAACNEILKELGLEEQQND